MLESKRRAIIFFLLAVALAAVSGFLVLQKVQAVNTNLGTMVTIYTAGDDIRSRQMIMPDQVTTDEVPQEYVRDEHITDMEELVNKVSTVPLAAGEVITTNMLKDASAITDANNRLVSVLRSDKVSFDERLAPLDRVDLIVSHSFGDGPVTEVFMEDVNVARVNTTENEEDGTTDFNGVQLEIPFERVPDLIHMQNYADSLRIVKANVSEENPQQQEGEQESSEGDNTSGDAPEENTEESEENNNTNEEQESEQSNDNNNESSNDDGNNNGND
ncbi:Flp pilus assembly protein CpaB [Lentibacillus sediminis]|uniref:Flp pilus assembly protein CpaB n=1 Tax=Lentibacillus sediminis TaxID=1940529 RepID=UPI000C1BDC1C|nr:SAF domain-containing protein [Lentibacillus sediminis]